MAARPCQRAETPRRAKQGSPAKADGDSGTGIRRANAKRRATKRRRGGGGGSPHPGLASKASTPGPEGAAFLPSLLLLSFLPSFLQAPASPAQTHRPGLCPSAGRAALASGPGPTWRRQWWRWRWRRLRRKDSRLLGNGGKMGGGEREGGRPVASLPRARAAINGLLASPQSTTGEGEKGKGKKKRAERTAEGTREKGAGRRRR